MFSPGEIYWADFPNAGRHPVIVVSAEQFNRGGYTTVVPVTSRHFERRRHLSNCVPFLKGEFTFSENCVAQAENILTLHMSDLDVDSGCVGKLDVDTLGRLIRAIGRVLDADCERHGQAV